MYVLVRVLISDNVSAKPTLSEATNMNDFEWIEKKNDGGHTDTMDCSWGLEPSAEGRWVRSRF